MITPEPTDLLLVIDVQRDYCGTGPVAVPDADSVVPPINALLRRFHHAGASQDWHPTGHISFASAHPDYPHHTIFLPECSQVLWPDHCLQGSRGAQFHPRLHSCSFEFILRTGTNPKLDSRSAFLESDGVTPIGLAGYMEERGFKRLFCVGLPLDAAVRFTAEDAGRMGFEAIVITDACRAIYGGVGLDDAMSMMARAGVTFAKSADIGDPHALAV